jgi:hypothetical protein
MDLSRFFDDLGKALLGGESGGMGCCNRRETLGGTKSNMEEVRREQLLTPTKRGFTKQSRDVKPGTPKPEPAGIGIVLETDEHHCDEQGNPKLFIAAIAAGGPADTSGELMAGGVEPHPRRTCTRIYIQGHAYAYAHATVKPGISGRHSPSELPVRD